MFSVSLQVRAKNFMCRTGARRADSTPKSWRMRRSVSKDRQEDERQRMKTWNAQARLTADTFRSSRSTVLSNFMFDDIDDDTGDSKEDLGAVDPFNIVSVEETDSGFVSAATKPTVNLFYGGFAL